MTILSGPIYTVPDNGQNFTFSGDSVDTVTSALSNSTLTLNGENADILIGDKSLLQILNGIEQRLGILHPKPELESRYQQLRELAEQYREMAKDLESRERVWKILEE